MEKITLTRDQLYNLVWSKPISVLAKEIGLSDNDLRKICQNHNIPNQKHTFIIRMYLILVSLKMLLNDTHLFLF